MIGYHIPVLIREVLKFLDVEKGKKFIDSTVGGGGHTEAILNKGGEVLGIDQDPISLEAAKKHLLSCPGRYQTVPTPGVFKLSPGNFANLSQIASNEHVSDVDGILFDLGFASFQMDDPERGLSLKAEGPLDMRLDPSLGVKAADLLNALPESQLYNLIKDVGEEKRARSITRAIISRRRIVPFSKTSDIRTLVENVYRTNTRAKIHPATKVFMALRIAVNSELDNLQRALPQALELTRMGGRIVVISFHSGEDRIVKNIFRDWKNEGKVEILTQKPVVPDEREILKNPRARSAKLRAVQKL